MIAKKVAIRMCPECGTEWEVTWHSKDCPECTYHDGLRMLIEGEIRK